MIDENFLKSIYALMISLGITKVEIDKELAVKSDDPPLYMTYDNKSKKYVFECCGVDKESDKAHTSGHSDVSAYLRDLLFSDPLEVWLSRSFYEENETKINAYLSIRGYQLTSMDGSRVSFEKMIPKKGWSQYE